MASDLEDRHKLILSDGIKYIELEVDGDSAVKLRSDLLYAKRHMLAIEQMLPASVKLHQKGDNLDKLEHFLLVTGETATQAEIDSAEDEYVSGDPVVWTNKSSAILCKLRLEMDQMFQGGPRNMKMAVWNKCAKTIRDHGFTNITGESCRKKWHNLMMTYKRIIDSNNQGRSNWEHYNVVHAVMQQQANNDPPSNLIVSSLSEPRKRKRRTRPSDVEPVAEVVQNEDLFEMPAFTNSSEYDETEYVEREPKNKPKGNEKVLKMILSLRRDELEFQQRESNRRYEERKERRKDRLKYREDKLKAIGGLTEVLFKLAEK